jgi:DNA modification methylase/superfamily II DNA or RNA helicase
MENKITHRPQSLKERHMETYDSFIDTKIGTDIGSGFEPDNISSFLFGFQDAIVRWAVRRGRACIFADCGLGKTPMQLEWARLVSNQTGMPVIIFAPLAVAEQTRREGDKFGIPVNVCRNSSGVVDGVNICNYEMMEHFDPSVFGGIVLDESSILKAYDGKTKSALIDFAEDMPYRLACTATPAPNDLTEICNHAEFMGVMTEKEVKAMYFTQDGNTTTQWRLKGHARAGFYKWMASWCVAIRRPSDIGFSDDGFALPALNFNLVKVRDDAPVAGELFSAEAITLNEQRDARRSTMAARVAECVKITDNDKPCIIWCGLNAESEMVAKAIPDAVEIRGSDSRSAKETRMMDFSSGKIRVLVTKPLISGFGMNWQHCADMIFLGMNHSYEQEYQAVRRSWRFGQKSDVTVSIVVSERNSRVVENVKRKEAAAAVMMDQLVKHMRIDTMNEISGGTVKHEAEYKRDSVSGDTWTAHLGDCVDVTNELDDNSIGLSVFSPPFPGMYVYSNSSRDMGNVQGHREMIEHFRYLSEPLLRKTKPGRSCAVHLTQTLRKKMIDGYTGLIDFRGLTIQMMEEVGWIYYGEITIDKNPQVKAIRTRDAGLQFKSLATDSSKLHVALADYILQFRKPGDNDAPIRAGISSKYKNPDGWVTQEEWIRWARPVWYGADWAPDGDGIRETNVLNVSQARDTDDERHLAPLQLGVIERCVKLWSAPGETVYSPFMGIGSEGYMAVKLGRKFIGAELKESYWKHAIRHIRKGEQDALQGTLFAGAEDGDVTI